MAGKQWDVVVVGAGNAAFCAALAAREKGASVLMVERAPKELMGGNSRFTAGAFRCVYDGVDDLKAIMPDLTTDEIDALRLRHLHRRPVLRRHVPRHATTAPTASCATAWSAARATRCAGCTARA